MKEKDIARLKKRIDADIYILEIIAGSNILNSEDKMELKNSLKKIKSLFTTLKNKNNKKTYNNIQNIENILNEMFAYVYYNYGGDSLDAIGKLLGITRERVRQIEKQAIKKIKLNMYQKRDLF